MRWVTAHLEVAGRDVDHVISDGGNEAESEDAHFIRGRLFHTLRGDGRYDIEVVGRPNEVLIEELQRQGAFGIHAGGHEAGIASFEVR